MRLDARDGPKCWGWDVFDVATCRRPEHVVWVDDESATWGQWAHNVFDEIIKHQERRITIYPARKLILFNEVDDEDSEGSTKTSDDRQEARADQRPIGGDVDRRAAEACPGS